MSIGYELSEVLSRYDIGKYDDAFPINIGTANGSYFVSSGGQRFVIRKRNPKYSSELWIGYEVDYLKHISYKKVPAPFPLMNIDGMYYCRINESVYQAYPYFDGETFDCRSLEDISEGGAFLGRLHMAVLDFEPLLEKVLPRYDSPSTILEILRNTIKEHEGTISLEERKTLDYIRNQAMLIQNFLPDNEYNNLPKLVIHGDYHPANVKYEDGKICALFDFDWISCQPRLRDIIDGLIYFSSERTDNIAGGDIFSLTGGYKLDIERSKLFLKAYSENTKEPLTQREFECIPYLIRARLIYSKVQALAKVPHERALEMLTSGIKKPLQWLNENQDKLVEALMLSTID